MPRCATPPILKYPALSPLPMIFFGSAHVYLPNESLVLESGQERGETKL